MGDKTSETPLGSLLMLGILTLFLATLIPAVSAQYLWRGQPCSLPNYHGTAELRRHQLDDGSFRCCEQVTCSTGTNAVPCTSESDPESTHCVECDGDTYMSSGTKSSDGIKCHWRQPCRSGHVTIDDGSIIENRQCACDLDSGFYKGNDGHCRGSKKCPAGEELKIDGTCKKCAPGFFKANETTGPCKNWRDCPDGYTMEHGNKTHDSECIPPEVKEVRNVTVDPSSTMAAPKHRESSEGDSSGLPLYVLILLILGAILAILLVAIFVAVKYYKKRMGRKAKAMNDPENGEIEDHESPFVPATRTQSNGSFGSADSGNPESVPTDDEGNSKQSLLNQEQPKKPRRFSQPRSKVNGCEVTDPKVMQPLLKQLDAEETEESTPSKRPGPQLAETLPAEVEEDAKPDKQDGVAAVHALVHHEPAPQQEKPLQACPLDRPTDGDSQDIEVDLHEDVGVDADAPTDYHPNNNAHGGVAQTARLDPPVDNRQGGDAQRLMQGNVNQAQPPVNITVAGKVGSLIVNYQQGSGNYNSVVVPPNPNSANGPEDRNDGDEFEVVEEGEGS